MTGMDSPQAVRGQRYLRNICKPASFERILSVFRDRAKRSNFQTTTTSIARRLQSCNSIELIPVQGGETHDAMFIHLPDEGVLFVGDVIMPYLGAPFVEEGDLQRVLDAIDIVVQKNPRYLLHGHEPLTRNFASASMLAQLKIDLAWLREQVLTATRRGDERGAIHQANLIHPIQRVRGNKGANSRWRLRCPYSSRRTARK